MPKYEFDYISNSRRYSGIVDAACTQEAAEKIGALPWAPGCGPVGKPKRWRQARRDIGAAGLMLGLSFALAVAVGLGQSETEWLTSSTLNRIASIFS